MEDNLKNGRIVYDIDEGIIKKRVDGKWLQLPSNINSSSVSSTTNTPINNIIRLAQNYVNNSQENFTFPTNEQLQAMDNKKISESTDTLNLKEIKRPQKEETYKTNLERSSGLIEQKIKAIEEGKIKRDEVIVSYYILI